MGNNIDYCCGTQRKDINFKQAMISRTQYLNNLIEYLEMQSSTLLADKPLMVVEPTLDPAKLDFNDEAFLSLIDENHRLTEEAILLLEKICRHTITVKQEQLLNDYIQQQLLHQSDKFNVSAISKLSPNKNASFMDDSFNYQSLLKNALNSNKKNIQKC